MNDLKKFNIGVSVGFLKVENTEIEVLAKNQEHAEDLALDYAKQNHNSCDWRD
jgi:F0F1-type ATP synthase epsilon subunit